MSSASHSEIDARYRYAGDIARAAGSRAMSWYQQRQTRVVEHKRNLQEVISEADRNVEALIKSLIAERFPEDAVYGAESNGLLDQRDMFIRIGSGALTSAWATAGRLTGYDKAHMHPLDSLPGIVLMREAGGVTHDYLRNNGLKNGNPVLLANTALYPQIKALTGHRALDESMTLPTLCRCALIFFSLWLLSPASQAADYQLEKVVELSRHGIRPPTPGNRKEIEAASQQPWTRWTTADGELTGHGYSAVVNKGRWEGDHYRRLGLLEAGCPDAAQVYVRASPLQRTRATASALVDGAFPGCGVPVHHVAGDVDPLFQSEKLTITRTDPAQELAAKQQKAGDLAQRQQQLQPAIQQLKTAVCPPATDCPLFDAPWSFRQTRSGNTYVYGLSVMASMVETLRLGYSENLPVDQLAWGHITSATQITSLLPLLTANYDLSNDILYQAQRRGSILLNTLLEAIVSDGSPTRWLILVAHDTNIAMVRTLIDFSWQLPGYARGNIPPGSSLVLERWRDTHSGERFLRLYFQAQSLDALRQLQPIDDKHPLLRQEWRQPDCSVTNVGLLCPYQSTLTRLRKNQDNSAVLPVSVILP